MSTPKSRSRRRDARAPGRDRIPEQPAAARALLGALAALAASRALLALPGTMGGWGLSLLRFAPPLLAWSLWGLGVALLIPGLARPVVDAADRVAPRSGAWGALLATAMATIVLVWPDRLHFVGDYLLREGTAARALSPAGLFPQALPLDVVLHYRLPRALVEAWNVPTAATERVLGALEAASLGALGYAFARGLRLRGAVAAAIGLVAACGGFLGVFTGYGKAIAEMTVLTLATGVFAGRALDDARWLGAVGLAVAVGLVLHRSALALLPAAILAAILVLRARPAAWKTPFVSIGLGLAVLSAVIMLPRIVTAMRRFDPVHFTPLEGAAAGGAVRALWSGTRPLDLINVLTLVAPLALVVPVAAVALGAKRLANRLGAVLLALAAPWLAMTLLIHPPQGMFRDWDDYAAAGAALSLIAAWLVARAIERAPSRRWLAPAAAMAALGPALAWLAIDADVARGMKRIDAYLAEPPRRSDAERGRIWDFLGIRNAQLGRWNESAEAMAKAAQISPSPRVLLQWALAEQARGSSRVARDAFRRVTEIQPSDARAWYGLAAESWNLGDYDECRRATERLEQVSPGSPEARALFQSLEKVPTRHDQGAR